MKRLALISFLLAALVHSGRAQAQPERPDHVVFEYAVFWPSSPKNPPLSVLKEVGAKRHPELRFVAAEEQAPADIAVFARVLDTKTYPPPSPAVIKSRGRGIRPSVVAKVGKSPSVLVVRTSCRRGDVGRALRSVAHLLEYVARRSRAWVWDAATRELFTAGQWKKLRTTGWLRDTRGWTGSASSTSRLWTESTGRFLAAWRSSGSPTSWSARSRRFTARWRSA